MIVFYGHPDIPQTVITLDVVLVVLLKAYEGCRANYRAGRQFILIRRNQYLVTLALLLSR